MSYDYATERARVFTEPGVIMLLSIKERAVEIIKTAGCVRLDKIIDKVSGDSWQMLACVDFLVETRQIVEVRNDQDHLTQHRIFTLK